MAMMIDSQDSFDAIMAIQREESFETIMDASYSDDDDDGSFIPAGTPPSVFRARARERFHDYRQANFSTRIEESPPPRRPWLRDVHQSKSSSSPNSSSSSSSSETKRKKRSKRSHKKQPSQRYPLDGTSPSERMLACWVCCADYTLDGLEGMCGVEEEMQTIRDDVAWCRSFLDC